jgi:hypothetical protein
LLVTVLQAIVAEDEQHRRGSRRCY